MVELSSEEERALKELANARTDASSVRKFIENRLYVELSHLVDEIEQTRAPHPGYEEQKQVYESLVKKGMLEGSRPGGAPFYWFGDLTSDGRCYFADKKAREDAERKRLRSDRAHDYRVACFSFAGGALAGGIVTFLLHFALGL